MPNFSNFSRPTQAALLSRVQGDIEAELDGVSARIRRTPEFAIAASLAGLSHSMHGHMQWIADGHVLPSPTNEVALDRFAEIILSVPRKQPSQAAGNALATGSGGDLLTGQQIVNPETGLVYTVDSDVLGITTSVAVPITAVLTGAAGNMSAGDAMNLAAPVVNVDSELTVDTDGIKGGADLETRANQYLRLLDHMKKPPRGGAAGDHEKWAKEVSAVTRAWEVNYKNGLPIGVVHVITVLDDHPTDITPNGAKLTELEDYIQPLSNVDVVAVAPSTVAFDFTLDADITDVQKLVVEAEVADMVYKYAFPGGIIRLARVHAAIESALGTKDFSLTSPTADKVHTGYQLPIKGTATFI